MSSNSKGLYRPWFITIVTATALLALPVLAVVFLAITGKATAWQHIQETLLGEYLSNTLFLVAGVAVLTGFLGLVSALLVVFVDFPLKKFFQWALVLPLSIPAYLMAFSYADITGYGGWMSVLFGFEVNLMNKWGAVLIFSLALYPYVYLPLKAFFSHTGSAMLETAASLGQSSFRAFFSLLFPLARPVIFGGIFLAITEVLNDFGLVKYFGVPTFTVGIFRAWTGFADLTSALRLSTILLFFVFAVLWFEKWLRKNKRFNAGRQSETTTLATGWLTQSFAVLWCVLLLALAFLMPFLQMILGVLATATRVMNTQFLEAFWHSCQLATLASVLVVVLALLIEFSVRLTKGRFGGKSLGQLAGMGYFIPGAIIALGVLAPLTAWDKLVYAVAGNTTLLLSTTIIALVYALIVRYMAVGLQAVQGGYNSLSPNLLEAALSLGKSPIKALFSVDFKVLRNFMATGFILVFVDVLKELPLTMILRPFNFDTLATKAFNLASDELLREAANASLLIVVAGMIPVFFLNRFINNASAKR